MHEVLPFKGTRYSLQYYQLESNFSVDPTTIKKAPAPPSAIKLIEAAKAGSVDTEGEETGGDQAQKQEVQAQEEEEEEEEEEEA